MKTRWIKVSEKTPAEKELILLFNNCHEEQHIGWFDEANGFNWGDCKSTRTDGDEISHWQPLPDDPTD